MSGGEDAFLEAVRRALGTASGGPGVELGIGDDAAVLRPPPGQLLVASVDMLVEDQHFRRRGPGAAAPADIGWRALAVNLSDLAAMGAWPLWALVSVGVPGDFSPADLEGVYGGLAAAARGCGLAVVGGNLAVVPERLVLDVTVLGAATRPVARTGGRPGDLVCVTGRLGAAAAGLALLSGDEVLPEWVELRQAQWRPQPRLAEGRALAALSGVHAMCDVSDGLARDLARLCGSELGAVLRAEDLPVPASVVAVAARSGRDPLEWALGGGEDYELLCLVAPGAVAAAQNAVAAVGGAPLTVIGTCRAQPGLHLQRSGTTRPLVASGWDPFA